MISKLMAEVMARLSLGRSRERRGPASDPQDAEHRALYAEASLGRVWPEPPRPAVARPLSLRERLRRMLTPLQAETPLTGDVPDPRISAVVAQLRQSVGALPQAGAPAVRQTATLESGSARPKAGEPVKVVSAAGP